MSLVDKFMNFIRKNGYCNKKNTHYYTQTPHHHTQRRNALYYTPYIISFAIHGILLVIIATSLNQTIHFKPKKNAFISVNITMEDIKQGNSDKSDKFITKTFHNSTKQTQPEIKEEKKAPQAPQEQSNNVKEFKKNAKDVITEKKRIPEKKLEQPKVQPKIEEKKAPQEQSKKKFNALGGFLNGINTSKIANIPGTDATSIQEQIMSIWAISVFDQKSIKGIIVMTEITIVNSEIRNISIIDEMGSHKHEKYAMVRESVIKALQKCKKLNIMSRFKSGEHVIRFKFVV